MPLCYYLHSKKQSKLSVAYFAGMYHFAGFRHHTDEAVLGKIREKATQVDLARVSSNAGVNERLYSKLREKIWQEVKHAPCADGDLVDGRFRTDMIRIRLNLQCGTFEDFLDLIRAASFTNHFQHNPMKGNLFNPPLHTHSMLAYMTRRIDEILVQLLNALTTDFTEDFRKEATKRIEAKKAREAAGAAAKAL